MSYYFIYAGFPLAKPTPTSFAKHFVCSSNKSFLDDADGKRAKMIESLSSNISPEAVSLAIEEYLPYVFTMHTVLTSNKAEKKNAPYEWESLITFNKKPFSSNQIEFELTMTLINYAFSLANLGNSNSEKYFNEIKTGAKPSETGQDIAKKCNHFFRRAAGVLEYVKYQLIPLLYAGVPLPLETEVTVCQALIDIMCGLAQVFTLMIGKETNVNNLTLAKVALGTKSFLFRGFTVLNKHVGSNIKMPIAPPVHYILQLVTTYFESMAYYYVAESLFKKDLVESSPAVAFYKRALELNAAAQKFKVYVHSAADLQTVKDFGVLLKQAYDTAEHDNTHVYYKSTVEFSQVQDIVPQEAVVTKPMEYGVSKPMVDEIR